MDCLIKFLKTHPDAVLPKKNHSNDSGFDIVAVEDTTIHALDTAVVLVGLTLAYITPGYWFEIKSRSGNFFKRKLLCFNGIIDEGYRNDLSIGVINLNKEDYTVIKGDKIAQLIVYPLINVNTDWTDKIVDSERGEKGIGSSGR